MLLNLDNPMVVRWVGDDENSSEPVSDDTSSDTLPGNMKLTADAGDVDNELLVRFSIEMTYLQHKCF